MTGATKARAALDDWFNRLDFDRSNEATRHAEYAELQTILAALSQSAGEAAPVAWRWRPRDGGAWIYDPTPEWVREQGDDPAIEFQPLYAAPPASRGDGK